MGDFKYIERKSEHFILFKPGNKFAELISFNLRNRKISFWFRFIY